MQMQIWTRDQESALDEANVVWIVLRIQDQGARHMFRLVNETKADKSKGFAKNQALGFQLSQDGTDAIIVGFSIEDAAGNAQGAASHLRVSRIQ